ncbi:hypothetical protein HYX06_04090 [Candidatus Woesearchaeota archaeon]|nr:hypothetical protein [Candidatus Woesearchaeota archaeon]
MGRWRNLATGCSVDTQRGIKPQVLASLANYGHHWRISCSLGLGKTPGSNSAR